MKAFDGAFDGQLGAGLGDVLHGAVAPPGAVDPHHEGGNAALEGDAFAFAPFHHVSLSTHHKRNASPRSRLCSLGGGWLTSGKGTEVMRGCRGDSSIATVISG